MLSYYVSRTCIAALLLGAGIFCLRKMLTVQPHRLMKENHCFVAFRTAVPGAEPGTEYARFDASRSNLVGTAIFAILFVVVGAIGIRLQMPSFAVYLFPLTLGLLHTLNEGMKSVRIHRYGIVVKNAFGRNFHPYATLDCLESYNVLNSFHKGVSYGYRWVKEGREAVAMDMRQYPDVARIESVFAAHPELVREPEAPSNDDIEA